MPAADEAYSIRPSFKEKFRPAAVKSLISAVLSERLQDKTCAAPSKPPAPVQHPQPRAACACRYNPESTATWTKEIADEIKSRLKSELELPRYKFVVQVCDARVPG